MDAGSVPLAASADIAGATVILLLVEGLGPMIATRADPGIFAPRERIVA